MEPRLVGLSSQLVPLITRTKQVEYFPFSEGILVLNMDGLTIHSHDLLLIKKNHQSTLVRTLEHPRTAFGCRVVKDTCYLLIRKRKKVGSEETLIYSKSLLVKDETTTWVMIMCLPCFHGSFDVNVSQSRIVFALDEICYDYLGFCCEPEMATIQIYNLVTKEIIFSDQGTIYLNTEPLFLPDDRIALFPGLEGKTDFVILTWDEKSSDKKVQFQFKMKGIGFASSHSHKMILCISNDKMEVYDLSSSGTAPIFMKNTLHRRSENFNFYSSFEWEGRLYLMFLDMDEPQCLRFDLHFV